MQDGSNKKRGIVTIALTFAVIASSIAMFTDYKLNSKSADMGQLSVESRIEYKDLKELAPGDTPRINQQIENTGTLDAQIRTTYILAVPEEEEFLYEPGWLKLTVDGNEVLTDVNVTRVYDTGQVISVGGGTDLALVLEISDEASNKIQTKGFRLDILTEARQPGDIDWETIRTEEIGFGNEVDYDVVPAANLISSPYYNIGRPYLANAVTRGYSATSETYTADISVDEYKTMYDNEADTLKIYDENNTELQDDAIVTEGMRITLEKEGKEYDGLYVVRKGDGNFDGTTNVIDVDVINRLIHQGREGKPQDEIRFYAMDLDNDSKITDNDSQLTYRYIARKPHNGIEEIYPRNPILPVKPRIDVRFKDASTGEVLHRGAEVSPGQELDVDFFVDSVSGIGINWMEFKIKHDSDYENFYLTKINRDFGVITNEEFDKLNDRQKRRYMWDLSFNEDVDGEVSVTYAPSSNTLDEIRIKGTHTLFTTRLKVFEDAKSGERINVSVEGLYNTPNFVYELKSGLTFADDTINRSNFVIVK